MSNLISRSFQSPDDLQAMIALTQALRGGGQVVYPIAADLFEDLADAETQAAARLWENEDGELVGFAYVNRWQNLVDVFTERAFTEAIEAEVIEWVIQTLRVSKTLRVSVDASALESDQARIDFLERHGFEGQAEASLLMARPITEALPEPVLPPGFRIRPMGGEAEIEAYVALHRAAFGTENMTVEYRRTIMSAPDYLPELDLVAVAPNGELAALCVCQIFPDDAPRAGGQKEGWTDPIAVHPKYQRMGLAKALMVTGMRLLQQRGIDTAILGTSSENMAMQKTAEAVGFHLVAKTVWYRKAP